MSATRHRPRPALSGRRRPRCRTRVFSVFLPYTAYLRRPDLISLAPGSPCRLRPGPAAGPRGRSRRMAGPGAGYSWFLPAHSPSRPPRGEHERSRHRTSAHRTAWPRCCRRRHVQGPGQPRVARCCHRLLCRLTAVLGYGFRSRSRPLAWRSLSPSSTTAIDGGHRSPTPMAAGLVLGLGLVVDALLRELAPVPARPETWISLAHPAEFAVRPCSWLWRADGSAFGAIDVGTDSLAALTETVADELGAPDLRIALSDGTGGWLLPSGEAWGGPRPQGVAVPDVRGSPCAVLEGTLTQPVTPAIRHVLRLAMANAQLGARLWSTLMISKPRGDDCSQRRTGSAPRSERNSAPESSHTSAPSSVTSPD